LQLGCYGDPAGTPPAHREITMKALSEQFAELAVRTRKLEDEIAAVKQETREKLDARRAAIHAKVEAGLNDINAATQKIQGEASSDLTALRSKISSDVAHVKQRVSAEVTKLDAARAARRADSYESDAELSIQYALYAIDQAEAAALDAIAARAEADGFTR